MPFYCNTYTHPRQLWLCNNNRFNMYSVLHANRLPGWYCSFIWVLCGCGCVRLCERGKTTSHPNYCWVRNSWMKSSKAHYSPVCSAFFFLRVYTSFTAGVHVQFGVCFYTHASKNLSTLTHSSRHACVCVCVFIVYGNNFVWLPISPSIWCCCLLFSHLKSHQKIWCVCDDLHEASTMPSIW